jgi:hypothetical protein
MLHMYGVYLMLKAAVLQLSLLNLLQSKDIFTLHRVAGLWPSCSVLGCPHCHLLYQHTVCHGLEATECHAVGEDQGPHRVTTSPSLPYGYS